MNVQKLQSSIKLKINKCHYFTEKNSILLKSSIYINNTSSNYCDKKLHFYKFRLANVDI